MPATRKKRIFAPGPIPEGGNLKKKYETLSYEYNDMAVRVIFETNNCYIRTVVMRNHI